MKETVRYQLSILMDSVLKIVPAKTDKSELELGYKKYMIVEVTRT